MSKLAAEMTLYAAYHQDPRNRLTHFFGVPTIVFSVLLFLAYAQIEVAGLPLSAATIFIVAVSLYYISLDALIGATLFIVTLPLLWAAHWFAGLPVWIGAGVGIVAFVGGWIVQLVGHKYEGNKPALLTGLWQMLMAPLFLCAEAMFLLGFRKGLEAEVQRNVDAFIAEHGKPGVAAAAPARA